MHTKNKTNEKKLVEEILASKSEVVKMGVDVHARDLVVSVQLDASQPQRGRTMSREQLLWVVAALVNVGVKVCLCQECGPCGYVLHRQLEAAGAKSYMVKARDLTDGRGQKTDGLDAVALTDNLDRYTRGHTRAMTVVRAPSEPEEMLRAQGRLRDQLRKSRHAWEARGRSLLLTQGHHISGAWWQPRAWEKLLAEHALSEWLKSELQIMRAILLGLDGHEKSRREQLEAAAPPELPKAVGALSWVSLGREICAWDRFTNRRQVASYTGLCPGIHQTGTTCRTGSINRHGNPRVRHLLIEMIWRLMRWQPDYPPVRKLIESGARGAQRRKLVVAAARRLAIDLWRLATRQTTAHELHLLVPDLLAVR